MLRTLCAIAVLLALGCATDVRSIDSRTYDLRIQNAYRAYQRGDYELAFQRFDRAARLGDKGSQYMLARMYLLGEGTEYDVVTGAAWLNVAAERGDEKWVDASVRLFEAVRAEQKVEILDLTNELVTRHGMKAQGITCGRTKTVRSHIPRMLCRKDFRRPDRGAQAP